MDVSSFDWRMNVIGRNLLGILARYEQFLSVSRGQDATRVLRIRAIYSVGWAFIVTQCFNLLGMALTYRSWTYDHTIAILAIVVVLALIHILHYFQSFKFYALAFNFLIISAVLASATPEGTGINSALLPFVIMAPFVGGFVAGWRMAVVSALLAFCLLAGLYYISAFHSGPEFIAYPARNFQRYLQSVFALMLATPIAVVFSANTFRAFKLLEQDARRAQAADRAKTEFLANMSHELRTPMSGVLGLTDALRTTKLDHHQRRLVSRIGDSGRLLLRVLNDILDLSKVNAGKLDVNPEPFSPHQVVRAAEQTWAVAAEAKHLGFKTCTSSSTPSMVVGDDRRIRQIVYNLLSNAIKFTRTGEVTLSVYDRPGGKPHETVLVFEVIDTGVGVSPEVAEKIYDAFEQGDVGVSRTFGGTGLGLSVSKKLAALMGGDLSFQPRPDGGSIFTLRVPVFFASSAEDRDQDADEHGPAVPDGLRVLVVEDDKTNQFVIFEILRGWQADVDIVEDGAQCLQRLDKQTYDLILMDKRLPVMDGIAATHAIRRRQSADHTIPIIAMTAETVSGEKDTLLAEGMDGFIPKPLRASQVRTAIAQALEDKAAVEA